jgi:diguanylate cyclase (GGDEF)-like protein
MKDDPAEAGCGEQPPMRAMFGAVTRRYSWYLVVGSFATLTLLIGLFSIHSMRAAAERRDAENWHTHTLDVLLVAEHFRASTFDMLRGERGYLLTDQPQFLAPYREGAARAQQQLERLASLTAYNAVQRGNVAAMRVHLQSFHALIARAIDLQRRGDHAQALAIVRAGFGKREFEELQSSIAALAAAERRLLITRREALAATATWNERLGYGAAALTLLLLGVAALAALAALRAQRHAAEATEELRRLATVDELTGLPNRRQFLARLEQELARSRRNGTPLCLATIDLDHFKRINDRHGHPAGDTVLRHIAAVIREKIRIEDSPARLGGEEFALLLPNTHPHQAHLVCDRLREAIASRLFELPGGGAIRVTLSTGVAALEADENLEALMRRSDEALYDAKEHGRNQVCLAA